MSSRCSDTSWPRNCHSVLVTFVVSVKSVSVFLIVSKVVVPCCEGGTKVFLTLFASV